MHEKVTLVVTKWAVTCFQLENNKWATKWCLNFDFLRVPFYLWFSLAWWSVGVSMGVSARKRAQGRVSGSAVQGPVSRNENVTVHTRARTGLECVAALSRCKGISFANDWTGRCWKPAVGEKNFGSTVNLPKCAVIENFLKEWWGWTLELSPPQAKKNTVRHLMMTKFHSSPISDELHQIVTKSASGGGQKLKISKWRH